MKKCPDCAELVQDDARVCRFCRHEFSQQGASKQPSVQPRKNNAGCLAAICIGVIALVAVASGNSSETSKRTAVDKTDQAEEAVVKAEPKPESPYADTGKQMAWISNGQESIKNQLKDPKSATFRNVTRGS